jgi:hypothetical protein
MPKELIKTSNLVDIVKLPSGQVITNETDELEYTVVKAAPKTDPENWYIRLHNHITGESYKWNALLDDWDDAVEADDPRWEIE